MHLLLAITSILLLIVGTSYPISLLLNPLQDWEKRRRVQLVQLFLPTLSLIVLPGGIWHLFDPLCIRTAPLWDHFLDIGVIVLFAGSIVGSAILAAIRLVLMHITMKHQPTMCHPSLETRVKHFAVQQGMASIRVRVVSFSRPQALIYGIWQPTLLLSAWMEEHLDPEELEAVLAHELAHIRRVDYLINWIALFVRDAFFYLPPVRAIYTQLQQERELACDDLVTQMTHRPLALASALTKVWLHLTESSPTTLAQTLVGTQQGLEYRIERLLSAPSERLQHQKSFLFSQRIGISLSLFFLVGGASFLWMIALLQCWPILSRLSW
jgi:beta-lactamase regulating signal transducer with metallopeptidase domain